MYKYTTADIIARCAPHSMISKERFEANIAAVDYIQRQEIPGDVVEIGVWKGGSILSMMLASENYKSWNRTFHLYDTFEGMTPATAEDKDHAGNDATALMETNPFIRCVGPYDEVRYNISKATDIIPQYHVGDILKNTYIPDTIALLRLDTDWYASTKHELDTFYPHVAPGGIVIIDDYGHWQGCRQAVDEFLATQPGIVLHTIDYTGRYFIKPPLRAR